MPTRRIALAALAALASLPLACGDDAAAPVERTDRLRGAAAPGDRSRAAAAVDGEVIGLDEVRALMDASDAGLTAREAVEALVDERLLAREAERRGVGGPDVAVERERAIVRRLMKKIREETTAADVDRRTLSDAYEAQKERFVHGPKRGVIHALAIPGPKAYADAAARSLAEEVAAAARGAGSEDEFEERARPFQSRGGGVELRIERIPDFAADTRAFDATFVREAFAVPEVGGISAPFRTSFGWHVVYVARELPPENIPFEKARAVLAAELLPLEKQRRIDALLDRLVREKGVFLYDAPGAATGERPAP